MLNITEINTIPIGPHNKKQPAYEISKHSFESDYELQEKLSKRSKILSQNDLYNIFPFGKEKVLKLLNSGELPVVRVGKDYITTFDLLEKWIEEHAGEEIYY